MKSKAFTLAEIIIVLTIIGTLATIMMVTVKPDKFRKDVNLANARKAIEFINQAAVQILDLEHTQCPSGAFMVKPAGTSAWEFDCNTANSTAIATLFGNYIKYETSVIDFCAATGACPSGTAANTIMGARTTGDIYIGFEKTNIGNCPAYRIPGETTDTAVPTKLNVRTGNPELVQCWGKVYIDVDYKDKRNTIGDDLYVYGLGQYGIVK